MAAAAGGILRLGFEALKQLLFRAGPAVAGAGAGATAGDILTDEVERRKQEKEKEKSKQIARATPITETKKECEKCPPDCGSRKKTNHSMNPRSRAYQARITGFPSGPTWAIEWDWGGRDFDGFVSAQCLLQETKADYDQFFDGPGILKPWYAGFNKMYVQASNQAELVAANPPAQLCWHFETPWAFAYMEARLNALPSLTAVYEP